MFLATGGSYTASATQLGMHKNSVKYRVEALRTLPESAGGYA